MPNNNYVGFFGGFLAHTRQTGAELHCYDTISNQTLVTTSNVVTNHQIKKWTTYIAIIKDNVGHAGLH